MPQRVRLLTILAGLVTAAAWWVTGGVLDLVIVDGEVVRLAHLPGWEALAGFLIAATAVIGMGSVVLTSIPLAPPSPVRWVPLLALAPLGLPYLPVIADTLPALRVLAGPARSAVWTMVAGLLLWSLTAAPEMQARLGTRRWAWWPSAVAAGVALGIAAALLTGHQLAGPDSPAWAMTGLTLALAAVATWVLVEQALQMTGEPVASALSVTGLLLSVPALLNVEAHGAAAATLALVSVASAARWPLAAGLACGALTWFGAGTIPMAMLLLIGRIAGAAASAPHRSPARTTLATLVLPFLAAIVLGATGLVTLPQGWAAPPASGGPEPSPAVALVGLAGLLIDQRHGLLFSVPLLWTAFTGAATLWRRGPDARAVLVTNALASVALLIRCAMEAPWWGAETGPPWTMGAALPLLAPLVAAGWSATPAGSARRATCHMLFWLGIWMGTVVLWSDAASATVRGFPGLSPVLAWVSPLNDAWRWLPTFRHDALTTALMHGLAWIAAAGGAALVLRRLHPGRPGVEAVRALSVAAAAFVAATGATLLWPHDADLRGPRPDARSRLGALDRFDARARPAALLYTPLTWMASGDTLPLLPLGVTPGLRTEPQPLRVLLNGRWSLPAGHYRITVEWDTSALPTPESVGVQVGRTGPPLATIDVGGVRGRVDTELSLPLDATFVGLRGSTATERALTRITVTPQSVVPAALRPPTAQVVGATHTPGGLLLIHTDTVGIEAGAGAWVLAGAPSLLSLADTAPMPGTVSPALTVRLRSDSPANRVTLSSRGWHQTVVLKAGVPLDVAIPRTGAAVTPLTVQADSAYIPAEHVPGSDDRRPLGVWITRPSPADAAIH